MLVFAVSTFLFVIFVHQVKPSRTATLNVYPTLADQYFGTVYEVLRIVLRHDMRPSTLLMQTKFQLVMTSIERDDEEQFLLALEDVFAVFEKDESTANFKDILMAVLPRQYAMFSLHHWLLSKRGKQSNRLKKVKPQQWDACSPPALPSPADPLSKAVDALAILSGQLVELLHTSIFLEGGEIICERMDLDVAMSTMDEATVIPLNLLTCLYRVVESAMGCMSVEAVTLVNLYKNLYARVKTFPRKLVAIDGGATEWKRFKKLPAPPLNDIKLSRFSGDFAHNVDSVERADRLSRASAHVISLPKPIIDAIFPMPISGNLINLASFMHFENVLYNYRKTVTMQADSERIQLVKRMMVDVLEDDATLAMEESVMSIRLFTSEMIRLVNRAVESVNAESKQHFYLYIPDQEYFNHGHQASLDYEVKRLLAVKALKDEYLGGDRKYDEIFQAALSSFTQTIRMIRLFSPQISLDVYVDVIKLQSQ